MQLLDLFWCEGGEVLHLAAVLGGVGLAQQFFSGIGDANGHESAVFLLSVASDQAVTLQSLQHAGHSGARHARQPGEFTRLELVVDPCGEQDPEAGERKPSRPMHGGLEILQES